MDDKVRKFLEDNHAAVMTTLKKDGTPHVARVDVGLVNGKLQSSATEDRLRTKHLKRDPRATLCVMDGSNQYRWLGIESTVRIIDGREGVDANLALYRAIAGEPDDLDEYLEAMVKERRIVYEFEIERTYGIG